MILAWQVARGVAYLKRIAIAQESLVAIERERTPASRPIKKAVLETASVTDWNNRWAEEHPVPEAEEGES